MVLVIFLLPRSLQQVDDKHIRMLHPYAAGGKTNHRPKTQTHAGVGNGAGNNLDKSGQSATDMDIVDAQFPRPVAADVHKGKWQSIYMGMVDVVW